MAKLLGQSARFHDLLLDAEDFHFNWSLFTTLNLGPNVDSVFALDVERRDGQRHVELDTRCRDCLAYAVEEAHFNEPIFLESIIITICFNILM